MAERKRKNKNWKEQVKGLSNKNYNYIQSKKRYEEEIVLPGLEKV